MSHLPDLIVDLALILGAAAIISLLFKKLKQPVVLGYILAGLLVGPNFRLFPTVMELESIRIWADIGVVFLLFALGLEFSFKKLVKVGGVAAVTALVGVSLTMLLGFSIARLMGWNNTDCLFFGGILAIASTTIIIRAFEELNVKTQKYTGIVLGVLIVEDLVAVVLMVVLSTVAVGTTFEGMEMLISVIKLVFFLVLWFVSGIFFLPTLLKSTRRLMNEETLLIVSLALCFFMVYLATKAGFSSALGAFIMGSILAETTKAEKIEHLIKPIKDLFGAIFFVSVGMLIEPTMLVKYAMPILAAVCVLIFGKPLFVTIGALVVGQPLKIAVQSGMSLSQIGEFSFIIATLGLSLKVTSDFLYPIAVAVSVLTTFTTPFMIRFSEPVHKWVEEHLPHKWKRNMELYSIEAENVRGDSDWKKLLRFYLINIIVFSVVIVTILFLCTSYLSPMLEGNHWGKGITAAITLVILSPFLWALAFRRTQKQAYINVWSNPGQRGPLITLMLSRILLAIFYVGFLFDQLFSPVVAFIGAGISVCLLLLFYWKIRGFYSKIELRFLSNLNARYSEPGTTQNSLAPWDSHVVQIELPTGSYYEGKTLVEARIREEFGVNIAMIERGDITLVIPDRDERLFPKDILSVIGTDEQLKRFKEHLEVTRREPQYTVTKREVSLQSFIVDEESALLNKSIRASGIRERSKGLIVGIERNKERILNPESTVLFHLNDKVWVVGNEKRIQVLIKERGGRK